MVSFCSQQGCLPPWVLAGWDELSAPDCFPVIRLLAKSRLGIPFCISGADEASYVSLVGVRLLNLINREKVVRRKKLHEFSLFSWAQGDVHAFGGGVGWGVLQGCMLMTPFWCSSYWICKPTLSTIALAPTILRLSLRIGKMKMRVNFPITGRRMVLHRMIAPKVNKMKLRPPWWVTLE